MGQFIVAGQIFDDDVDINEFGEIEELVLDVYDIDEDDDDYFDIIDIEEEDNEALEALNDKIMSGEINSSNAILDWYENEIKPYRTYKVKYLKKRITYRAEMSNFIF